MKKYSLSKNNIIFCITLFIIASIIQFAQKNYLSLNTILSMSQFALKKYKKNASFRAIFNQLPETIVIPHFFLQKYSITHFKEFAPLILEPYFLETPLQPTDYSTSEFKYKQAAPLLWNKWINEKIGKTCSYCVFNEKNTFIGTMELQAVTQKNSPAPHQVEITGFCFPASRGTSGAQKILSLITETLFSRTQIREIYARVSYKNQRCIHFLKKCNFSEIITDEKPSKELLFKYSYQPEEP